VDRKKSNKSQGIDDVITSEIKDFEKEKYRIEKNNH